MVKVKGAWGGQQVRKNPVRCQYWFGLVFEIFQGLNLGSIRKGKAHLALSEGRGGRFALLDKDYGLLATRIEKFNSPDKALFVKVKEAWRDSDVLMNQLGFDPKKI